jgi:hypothetical protein
MKPLDSVRTSLTSLPGWSPVPATVSEQYPGLKRSGDTAATSEAEPHDEPLALL